MKTASVAPTTERAPFIAHAHGSSSSPRLASSRMPAGMGIPMTSPAGSRIATATAMRPANPTLIAERITGGSATTANSPSAATQQSARSARPRTSASAIRRLR